MTDRDSLDWVGLRVAAAWAMRGTCARRRVGCLLVDVRGRTLATGYNGPPSGAPHCIDHPCPGAGAPSGQALDACEAIHAEQNALMQCPDVDAIHTAYLTVSPCLHCVKMLMNTGCRRIVFAERYVQDDRASARWISSRPDRRWVHIKLLELPVV